MHEEEKHTMHVKEPASEETGTPTQKKNRKSLIETMREIDAKEAQREQEAEERRQAIIAAQEKREKEEYSKKIRQERIELMRLKQGVIEESEIIREEKEEKKRLSLWGKIRNFLYHSKWWLGITVFIVGIFAFLIVDYVTQVEPDIIVMVLTDDADIQNRTPEIEAYFTQFTEDENGDDKIKVDIYPIPVNDNFESSDFYTGSVTKLSTQFQMADAIFVLTDAKANQYIAPDETLADLETLYPGHKNIREEGYYLRHTDFATKIGYPGNVDRDLSIGLRKPTQTYDSLEEMEENYAIAEKVFLRIMDDLDDTIEPEDIVETTPAETAEETEENT